MTNNGRLWIYVLMEHKSQPDPMTSFQMLKYIVRVLEQSLREDQPLACVIPLIVYHGEAAWTVARSLDDLLKVPSALKRHMPQFSPILLDLSHQPEEKKYVKPQSFRTTNSKRTMAGSLAA